MRAVVLDTETTGLDPFTGHKIIEIGCIELIDNFRTDRVFHHYIDPERDVPLEAFNVHGISSEFLRGKPLFCDIHLEFLEFIKDSQLIIHNAAFDLKFINYELRLLNMPPLSLQIIDTLMLARKKFPGARNSLDALCKRFKIDNSSRTKHGALLDSELLYEVYIKLIEADQSGISLEEDLAAIAELNDKKQVNFPERSFAISSEDEAAHQLFMKKIKNPVWVE